MKINLLKAVLISTLFISTHLSAALVTWNFSGSVVTPDPDGPYNDTYFDDTTDIQLGDRVEGSITWDPDVAVHLAGGPDGATWVIAQQQQLIDISATFFSASGPETFNISGMHGPYMLENWHTTMVGTPEGDYDVLSMIAMQDELSAFFRLVAPAFSNLFSLTGFDATPPSVDDLDLGRLHITYENPNSGEFDSLFVKFDNITAVSEPSALAIALLGLMVLARRRKH